MTILTTSKSESSCVPALLLESIPADGVYGDPKPVIASTEWAVKASSI